MKIEIYFSKDDTNYNIYKVNSFILDNQLYNRGAILIDKEGKLFKIRNIITNDDNIINLYIIRINNDGSNYKVHKTYWDGEKEIDSYGIDDGVIFLTRIINGQYRIYE